MRISCEGFHYDIPRDNERAISGVVRAITSRWMHNLRGIVKDWEVSTKGVDRIQLCRHALVPCSLVQCHEPECCAASRCV